MGEPSPAMQLPRFTLLVESDDGRTRLLFTGVLRQPLMLEGPIAHTQIRGPLPLLASSQGRRLVIDFEQSTLVDLNVVSPRG